MIDSSENYLPSTNNNSINIEEQTSNNFSNKEKQDNEPELSNTEKTNTELLQSTSLNNTEVKINDDFGLKDKLSYFLAHYEGENRDHIEALLQNDDVINLFINLVKNYDSSYNHDGHFEDKDTKQLIEEGFDIEDIPESWEEYLSIESSTDNFVNFLTNGEGLTIVKEEILKHVDMKNGKIYDNYPISNKDLMWKVKRSFVNNILNQYNTDYDIQEAPQERLSRLGDKIMLGIDDIVGTYLKGGGNATGKGLSSSIKSWMNEIDFAGLVKDDEIRRGLDTFFTLNIKELSNNVLHNDKTKDNLETGDTQLNLQLQIYLLIYDQYILSDQHLSTYENKELSTSHSDLSIFLDEILECESNVGTKRESERMKRKKAMEKEKKQKELERRKRKAEMNRKINSMNSSQQKEHKNFQIEENHKSNINVQEASGVELIKNGNLSDKIPSLKEKSELSEDEINHLKQPAFDSAWTEFLNQNKFMENIITKDKMTMLYDFNNNTINEQARENFKNHELLTKSQKEGGLSEHAQMTIDKIHDTLISFSLIMEKTLSNMAEKASNNKTQVDDTIKDHALGGVIDSMKGIFNTSQDNLDGEGKIGFILDEKEPIKISGNNMLMYGSFNGTKINLCYNMESGKLFINSYIMKNTNPDRITIGNEYPNKEIGTMLGFDDILKEYYNKPPLTIDNKLNRNTEFKAAPKPEEKNDIPPMLSPTPYEKVKAIKHEKKHERESIIQENENKFHTLLHKELNLIGDEINQYTNTEKYRNSLIDRFAKTFNLKDNHINKKLEFKKGNDTSNNAYEIFQILSQSSDTELKKFDIMLREICVWSGITLGQNNRNQNKSSGVAKLIFESEINNEDARLRSIKSFKQNMDSIGAENLRLTYNIDSDLGIVALLKKYCITVKDRIPRLDIVKMEQFMRDMEYGIADIKCENDLKTV